LLVTHRHYRCERHITCFVILPAENLSASKIVSIKDLRDMLQKTAEASAQRDLETAHETSSADRRINSASDVQTPSSSVAKPRSATSAPGMVAVAAVTSEVPRPTGMLASLLQGSQAAEAKAYFTGLLPGNMPPPRPVTANAQKPSGVFASKAGMAPSFTGFTGKLGSAPGGNQLFEFSAVSISCRFVYTFSFIWSQLFTWDLPVGTLVRSSFCGRGNEV